jgi:hypothetical protein
MRISSLAAASAVAMLLCAPASASETSGFSAGVTGGTLGIGPEVGYRFSDMFGVRANATFLNISRGFESDDIEYRGKVKLGSGGVMLDVYPFGGGFRVSGGARINGNKGRVRATPTAPVEINGTTYTPAQIGTLTGRAEVKDFAPALTLGYGGGLRSGFVFGVEAGALFQDKVRIKRFTSTGTVALPDLEAERLSIQDDVDDYKVYPILQLTLGYRF